MRRCSCPQARSAATAGRTSKGHFAQDALNRGNLYGFVSFSDHGSTHNSWACVWAPKEDREGLFDGMLARRTYAGSDEIIVKATAGGHMVGEQFNAPAGKAPRIEAQIDAPNTILRVDVVKDGKYIYTTRPNSRNTTLAVPGYRRQGGQGLLLSAGVPDRYRESRRRSRKSPGRARGSSPTSS